MKQFDIISIFPESVGSYLESSLLKKAQEKKLLKVRTINPRDFTRDKHHVVDLPPYGGGPGMVLKPEPIWAAVEHAKKTKKKIKTRVILFSLRGKKFTQNVAKRLAKYDQLIFICGRYEGVDERIAKYCADEEISIGDFVLSGGELPALIVLETVARHIPGFLGKNESLEDSKGSYPVYTRPEVFETKIKQKKKKLVVPRELISGNHAIIAEWRKKNGFSL
jgi:tRNA (guanine37-N1)-methyltransferase